MAIKAVSKYIYNLGKSVVYSTVDQVKEIAPETIDFAETNSDLAKDVYSSLKNYKVTYKKTGDAIKKSKIYEAANIGIKSFKEDLLTGNFYNKERSMTAGFGDFDDMSIDIDFNSSDFDNMSDDAAVGLKGDAMVAKSVNANAERISSSVGKSIARSTELIIESDRVGQKMSYAQSQKHFAMVSSSLDAINNNLGSMIQFANDAIKAHMQSAEKFYENMHQAINEQNRLLKLIQNEVAPEITQKDKTSNKVNLSDVLSGGLNLKSYAKAIKQNFMNTQAGQYLGLNSMMGDDTNMLANLASSPLQFIPNFIARLLLTDIKKPLAKFNKTFSGFFGSMLAKFNLMAENEDASIITRTIGKLFGVRPKRKDKIDTDAYEKGKIPWDGMAKKALTEVIPAQLSKIISLLGGKGEKIFDYKSGKWVKAYDAVQDYLKTRKSFSQKTDLQNEITENAQALLFNSDDDREKFFDDLKNFFQSTFSKGGYFNHNKSNESEKYNENGVSSEKNYKIILELFKNASEQNKATFNAQILNQIQAQQRYFENLEKESNTVFNTILGNFGIDEYIEREKSGINKGKIKGIKSGLGSLDISKVKDNLGNNVFYYLQELTKNIVYIRENGLPFGGGGGGNGSPSGFNDINNFRIDVDSIRNRHNAAIQNRRNQINSNRRGHRGGASSSMIYSPELGRYIDINNDNDIQQLVQIRVNDDLRANQRRYRQQDFERQTSSTLKDDSAEQRRKEEEYRQKKLEAIEKQNEAKRKRKDGIEYVNVSDMDPDHMGALRNTLTVNRVNREIAENREEIKRREQSERKLSDRLKDATSLTDKFVVFKDKVTELAKKPAKFIGNVLKKADKHMYNLLFGETKYKGQDVKGVMGMIKAELSNTFKKTNDWLDDHLFAPIKEKLGIKSFKEIGKKAMSVFGLDELYNNAKQALFGNPDDDNDHGILGNIKEGVKEAFKSTGNWIKEGFINLKDSIWNTPFMQSLFNSEKSQQRKREREAERERQAREEELERLEEEAENAAEAEVVPNLKGGKVGKNSKKGIPQGKEYDEERKAARGFGRRMFSKFAQKSKQNYRNNKEEILSRQQEFLQGEYNDEDDEELWNSMQHFANGGKVITNSNLSDRKISKEQKEANDKKKKELFEKRGYKMGKNKDGAIVATLTNGEIVVPNDPDTMNKKDFKEVMDRLSHATEYRKHKILKDASFHLEDENGMLIEHKVQDKIFDTIDTLVPTISNTFQNFLEKLDNPEKDRMVSEKVMDAMKETQKHYPSIFGGAAVGAVGGTFLAGAGLPLISSVFGGPFLGAGIGAAIALSKKSERFNKFLFGDEEGEGGVLPKGAKKWIEEKLPKHGRNAMLGALVGPLLGPFGLAGSMMLGVGIGHAVESEKFKKTFFGDDAKSSLKKKVKYAKEHLPATVLGAIGGVKYLGPLFSGLGPIGFMGAAALGSAASLYTTTDDFKRFLFGRKDPRTGKSFGGVLPTLRDKIINPMTSWMKEIGSSMKDWFKESIYDNMKRAFKPLSHSFKNGIVGMGKALVFPFKKAMDIFFPNLGNSLSRKFGGIVDKIAHPLRSTIELGGKLVGKPISWMMNKVGDYGDKVRSKHIANDDAAYMTAQERMEHVSKHGLGGKEYLTADRDKTLAEISSSGNAEETYNSINDAIDAIKISNKKLDSDRKDVVKNVRAWISRGDKNSQLDARDSKDLINAINKGNYDESLKTLEKSISLAKQHGETEKVRNLTTTYNYVKTQVSQLKQIDANKADKKSYVKSQIEALANNEEYGALFKGITSEKDLDRLQKYINQETKNLPIPEEKDPMVDAQEKAMEQSNEHHNELIESLTNITVVLKKMGGFDLSEEEEKLDEEVQNNTAKAKIEQAQREKEEEEARLNSSLAAFASESGADGNYRKMLNYTDGKYGEIQGLLDAAKITGDEKSVKKYEQQLKDLDIYKNNEGKKAIDSMLSNYHLDDKAKKSLKNKSMEEQYAIIKNSIDNSKKDLKEFGNFVNNGGEASWEKFYEHKEELKRQEAEEQYKKDHPYRHLLDGPKNPDAIQMNKFARGISQSMVNTAAKLKGEDSIYWITDDDGNRRIAKVDSRSDMQQVEAAKENLRQQADAEYTQKLVDRTNKRMEKADKKYWKSQGFDPDAQSQSTNKFGIGDEDSLRNKLAVDIVTPLKTLAHNLNSFIYGVPKYEDGGLVPKTTFATVTAGERILKPEEDQSLIEVLSSTKEVLSNINGLDSDEEKPVDILKKILESIETQTAVTVSQSEGLDSSDKNALSKPFKNSKFSKFKNLFKRKQKKTVIDPATGDIRQFDLMNNGDYELNLRDANTREAEKNEEKNKGFTSWLKDKASSAWGFTKEKAGKAKDKGKGLLGGIFGAGKGLLGGIFGAGKSLLGSLFGGGLTGLLGKGALLMLAPTILKTIGPMLGNVLTSVLPTIGKGLMNAIPNLISTAGSSLKGFMQGLMGQNPQQTTTVDENGNPVYQSKVQEVSSNVANNAGKALNNVANGNYGEAVGNVAGMVGNGVGGALDTAKSVVTLDDSGNNILDETVGRLVGGGGEAAGDHKSVANRAGKRMIRQALTGKGNTFRSIAKLPGTKLIPGYRWGMNKIANGWDKVTAKTSGLATKGLSKVTGIPFDEMAKESAEKAAKETAEKGTKGIIGKATDKVKGTVNKGVDKVLEKPKALAQKGVDKVLEKPKALAQKGIDSAKGLAQKGMDNAKGLAKKGVNKLTDKAKDVIAKKAGEGATDGVKKTIAKGMETAMDDGLLGSIKKGIKKVFSGIFDSGPVKSLLGSKVCQKALKAVPAMIEKLFGKLARKGANLIKSALVKVGIKAAAGIGPWALITAAVDFGIGFANARDKLGILDDPTFGQRLVSGLISAVTGTAPFTLISVLWTDAEIISFFVDDLLPLIGIKFEAFQKQRNKAKNFIDIYNKEHGTNYESVEEALDEEDDDDVIDEYKELDQAGKLSDQYAGTGDAAAANQGQNTAETAEGSDSNAKLTGGSGSAKSTSDYVSKKINENRSYSSKFAVTTPTTSEKSNSDKEKSSDSKNKDSENKGGDGKPISRFGIKNKKKRKPELIAGNDSVKKITNNAIQYTNNQDNNVKSKKTDIGKEVSKYPKIKNRNHGIYNAGGDGIIDYNHIGDDVAEMEAAYSGNEGRYDEDESETKSTRLESIQAANTIDNTEDYSNIANSLTYEDLLSSSKKSNLFVDKTIRELLEKEKEVYDEIGRKNRLKLPDNLKNSLGYNPEVNYTLLDPDAIEVATDWNDEDALYNANKVASEGREGPSVYGLFADTIGYNIKDGKKLSDSEKTKREKKIKEINEKAIGLFDPDNANRLEYVYGANNIPEKRQTNVLSNTFLDFISALRKALSGETDDEKIGSTLPPEATKKVDQLYKDIKEAKTKIVADRYINNTTGASKILSIIGERPDGFHEGIDYLMNKKTPIFAPMSGQVAEISSDPKGLGHSISIQDHDGYYHIFGQLYEKPRLNVGDFINYDSCIGLSGLSGKKTVQDPHLHYAIRKTLDKPATNEGEAIDPNEYLLNHIMNGRVKVENAVDTTTLYGGPANSDSVNNDKNSSNADEKSNDTPSNADNSNSKNNQNTSNSESDNEGVGGSFGSDAITRLITEPAGGDSIFRSFGIGGDGKVDYNHIGDDVAAIKSAYSANETRYQDKSEKKTTTSNSGQDSDYITGLKKVATLINQAETGGRFDAVTPNDCGAMAIGAGQMNGNHAKQLLKMIIDANPSDAKSKLSGTSIYDEVTNDKDWSSRVATDTEAQKIKELLLTSQGKEAQAKNLLNHINTHYQYGKNNYSLTDKALLYYCDLGNNSSDGSPNLKELMGNVVNEANGGANVKLDFIHSKTMKSFLGDKASRNAWKKSHGSSPDNIDYTNHRKIIYDGLKNYDSIPEFGADVAWGPDGTEAGQSGSEGSGTKESKTFMDALNDLASVFSGNGTINHNKAATIDNSTTTTTANNTTPTKEVLPSYTIERFKASQKMRSFFRGLGGDSNKVAGTSDTYVSSGYGNRTINGHTEKHDGIDYAIKEGSEVGAPVSGTITYSGQYDKKDLSKGFGNLVSIKDDKGYNHILGHLSKPIGKVGDKVNAGDLVGLSGNTGNSTGPHLHYGIRKNIFNRGSGVDPNKYNVGGDGKVDYNHIGDDVADMEAAYSSTESKIKTGADKVHNKASDVKNSTKSTNSSTKSETDTRELGAAAVANMRSVLGKLTYSMSGPRNPEKGSADCSSTVAWALNKAAGTTLVSPQSNTGTFVNLPEDNNPWVDRSGIQEDASGSGKNPDESKLQPGDVLLYRRTGGYTSGRKYRVGHIEMYAGDGKRLGHGGGMGPKETALSSGASDYIGARRIGGSAAGVAASSGSSSGSVSTKHDIFGFMKDFTSIFSGEADTSTSSSTSSGASASGTGVDGDLVNQDLKLYGPDSATADTLNQWINSKTGSSSHMYNKGEAFMQAAKETGFDPRYIVAHAASESGWGKSNICNSKANFYGIGAFDASPYASSYKFGNSSGDKYSAGIIEGAKWINEHYYNRATNPQKTLYSMRHNNGDHEYATDPNWDTTIAGIWKNGPSYPGSSSSSSSSSSTDTKTTTTTEEPEGGDSIFGPFGIGGDGFIDYNHIGDDVADIESAYSGNETRYQNKSTKKTNSVSVTLDKVGNATLNAKNSVKSPFSFGPIFNDLGQAGLKAIENQKKAEGSTKKTSSTKKSANNDTTFAQKLGNALSLFSNKSSSSSGSSSSSSSSSISPELLTLIKSIIEILKKVSDNTDAIKTIAELLKTIVPNKDDKNQSVDDKLKSLSKSIMGTASKDDLNNLFAILDSIATE